jgi:hypothetical protein
MVAHLLGVVGYSGIEPGCCYSLDHMLLQEFVCVCVLIHWVPYLIDHVLLQDLVCACARVSCGAVCCDHMPGALYVCAFMCWVA